MSSVLLFLFRMVARRVGIKIRKTHPAMRGVEACERQRLQSYSGVVLNSI